MKTIWILKGLPSSGKSTWAKEKVANSNCAIKRVNKDDLRNMLDSGKYSKGNEKFVLDVRDSIIRRCLNRGTHVIVDDTNFHPMHEEAIRAIAKDYSAEVKIKFFDVKPDVCIERDLKRPNSVGAKVIWKMYNDYIKEEKKAVEPMKQDTSLQHVAIFDIDGTVTLMGDRSPYDETRVDEDEPNTNVIRLVEQYASNSGEVIFLSGRKGTCRMKTADWIRKYISLDKFTLLMRKPVDNRKDSIIKKELFDEHIRDKYYVDYVVDDRLQVCRLWHSLGLTILRVGDPDANF